VFGGGGDDGDDDNDKQNTSQKLDFLEKMELRHQ
jgi:hypothetical protein